MLVVHKEEFKFESVDDTSPLKCYFFVFSCSMAVYEGNVGLFRPRRSCNQENLFISFPLNDSNMSPLLIPFLYAGEHTFYLLSHYRQHRQQEKGGEVFLLHLI